MFVSRKKYQEALNTIKNIEEKLQNIVSYSKDIDELKKIISELEEKSTFLEGKIDNKTIYLSNLTLDIKSEEKRLGILENKTKILDNELVIKNDRLEKLETDITIINEKKFVIQNSIEALLQQQELKNIELLKLKQTVIETSKKNHEKSTMLEQKYLKDLNEKIKSIEETIKQKSTKLKKIEEKINEHKTLVKEYNELKKNLIIIRKENDLQEVAFYKNVFPFSTTEQFKSQLDNNVMKQKLMVENKFAIKIGTEWTVNGSKVEGRKMTQQNAKAMLRLYNTECDNSISSLRYSNYSTIVDRIQKSYIAINKLNKKNDLTIDENYHELKLEELQLIYELKLFEEKEKEKLRILKAEERERKQVEKEIKEKLFSLEAHEKTIKKQMNQLNKEFTQSKGEKISLLNKIKKLEDSLALVIKKREEINRRQLVGKSGYVYIISNLGTLGENIYKIGMTRRLEPLNRIKELSGAAVPFEYDIHSMILTDDAPKLENHLHSTFTSRRVNLINNRKEFFNVSLDEIKKEVFSVIGKDVVFIDSAEAQQYYQTLALRSNEHLPDKELVPIN